MKSFSFIVLSTILVLQSTNAFPQLRFRRDVTTDVKNDLQLSPESAKKREELKDYVIAELIDVAKDSVDSHKKIFEKIIKLAEEDDLKSVELKDRLQKFKDIVDRANALTGADDKESIGKLFDLFGEASSLADRYDDIDSPTEAESLIKRLLDENGAPKVIFQFLVDFVQLRSNYEDHIQEYVDSLSDEDKVKDAKFLEWFKKFKTVKEFEDYVDVTLEVFEYLVGDDSDEKEE